jgi:ParB/RepB/Spo0J family partition protein
MDTAVTIRPDAYEIVKLSQLELSQTPMQVERRAHFDKKALAELAESIKEHGVLQPVLVRRRPGKHELVAGERRFIASRTAGRTELPAIVRDLTDLQVVEMQVIENNQREDLHKLVEAEGFEQLMKVHKLNADEIAAKIGKSRSYVYAVLKYCDLCPEARRAFYDGKLNPSTALLVARIGHHDTQRQALKDVTEGEEWGNGRRNGEPMSYREAHQHILENYTLKLKEAPFDINDAQLLPKAGTCQACPKRTGNQRDLFGDVKNADVCTDPKCFDDKRQAHFAGARKKLETQGHKVIGGRDAKKAMPHWENGHDHVAGDYVPLDERTYHGGSYKPVASILGPDYKPILLQHPGTGKIIKVATRQSIARATQQSSGSRGRARQTGYLPVKSSKPKGPDIDDVEMERLVALVHERAPKSFNKTFMHAFAKEIIGSYGPVRNGHDAIAKAWGWKGKPFGGGYMGRSLPKEALKLGDRDLIMLLFEVIFVSQYQRDSWLKLFGISGKDVRDQIIEDRRKAAAAARTAAKSKTPAKASAKPAKKK